MSDNPDGAAAVEDDARDGGSMAERKATHPDVSNTERRQRVIDDVRRRIVVGGLLPGQRVTEAELTAGLGVSRPTAREALSQLARDGFLVQEAYRGHRVAAIEPAALREIADVRVAIDAEAIREILADGTGASLAALEGHWRDYEASISDPDPLALHEAHLRFHRGVWDAADNFLLKRIWPVVEAQMTIALAYDQFTRRDAPRAHAVHAALMTAIRSGDDARIRAALEVHTIDSARELALVITTGAVG